MPFFIKVVHQHSSAGRIVIQHGQGTGQLLVIAVDENKGDSPVHQLLIEFDVRVGQTGFGALNQNTVQMLHAEQGHEDLALVCKLILCGKQKRGAVVFRTDGLNFAQDAGEDIVADIGGNHSDRKPAVIGSVLLFADVRSAALPPVDQAFRLQEGKRLPHRLPADPELGAERLLGGESLLIGAVPDTSSERVRNDLIFWIHSQTPVLTSSCSVYP